MTHNSPYINGWGEGQPPCTLKRGGSGGLGEEMTVYTSCPSCPNLSSCWPQMPVTEMRTKNCLKRAIAVQLGMRDIPETHC